VLHEPQRPLTIDDLAGPCSLNYDNALAEYEVVRRHFPELLLPRPHPDGRALDKQAAQSFSDALAKVMPVPMSRQRRRYTGR
jgi:hypothetical protein